MPIPVITTSYRGADVLALPPDLDTDAPALSVASDVDTFDADGGTHGVWTAPALPNTVRAFTFLLETRALLAAFEAFLAARAGQYAAFWMPSWADEFTVLSQPGTNQWLVAATGYPAALFPRPAFRHVAVLQQANVAGLSSGLVTAAVDNADGTETLTVPGVPMAPSRLANRTMLLLYSRLNEDGVRFDHVTHEATVVTLSVLHLPEETPA